MLVIKSSNSDFNLFKSTEHALSNSEASSSSTNANSKCSNVTSSAPLSAAHVIALCNDCSKFSDNIIPSPVLFEEDVGFF